MTDLLTQNSETDTNAEYFAFFLAYPLLETSQSAQAGGLFLRLLRPQIGLEVLDDLSVVSSSAMLEEVSAE